MRNKDANLVHFFHEGALKMRHHLEQSNAGDTDFDSKRLQIGLDLHYCGIYWTVLLRMASMTLENVDVDKNMHGIHLLESWINSSGLVGCWNWTPIFSVCLTSISIVNSS